MTRRVGLVLVSVIVGVALAGCGGGGGGGDGGGGGNTAPVINSLTPSDASIWPGESTTVTCNATDANGDNLTYTWSADSGEFTGTGATVTWDAPATGGVVEVECEVNDGNDGTVSDTVDITVGATVQGQLVAPDGDPVAGLQVAIDGITATTDAEGKFTAVGVGQGQHQLTITDADYVIIGGAVTVQANTPGELVEVPQPVPVIDIGGGPPPPPPI